MEIKEIEEVITDEIPFFLSTIISVVGKEVYDEIMENYKITLEKAVEMEDKWTK